MQMFSFPSICLARCSWHLGSLSKDPLDTEPTVSEIHYSGLSGVNTQILSLGGTSQRRNGGEKLHENS